MADGFIQFPPDSTGKKQRTVDQGSAGHVPYVDTNGEQKVTYLASHAPASIGFTTGTAKSVSGIWHAATAAKLVKVRTVSFSAINSTVVTEVKVELLRVTTVGTATSLAGLPALGSDAAQEATTQHTFTAEPTVTAGAFATVRYAVQTASINSSVQAPIVLYNWLDSGEQKALSMRAAVAEGYVVRFTLVGTSPAALITVNWAFTEE